MSQPKSIFLALPRGGNLIHGLHADTVRMACLHAQSNGYHLYIAGSERSALPANFNALWCKALNLNPRPTYFLMIHDDIAVEHTCFLDMIKVLEDNSLDVVSAVVPLKSFSGSTSTGYLTNEEYEGFVRRLSLKEIYAGPEPLLAYKTSDPLMINTGLMLVRFAEQEWVERVYFEFKDRIREDKDGVFHEVFVPEDWGFSKQINDRGIPYGATRAVKAVHLGGASYPNSEVWGDGDTGQS